MGVYNVFYLLGDLQLDYMSNEWFFRDSCFIAGQVYFFFFCFTNGLILWESLGILVSDLRRGLHFFQCGIFFFSSTCFWVGELLVPLCLYSISSTNERSFPIKIKNKKMRRIFEGHISIFFFPVIKDLVNSVVNLFYNATLGFYRSNNQIVSEPIKNIKK